MHLQIKNGQLSPGRVSKQKCMAYYTAAEHRGKEDIVFNRKDRNQLREKIANKGLTSHFQQQQQQKIKVTVFNVLRPQ